MLKIFDQHKNPLGYIVKYTDLCNESELSTGDKTLSFTYRAKSGLDIRNEYYVETKEDRYVVKGHHLTISRHLSASSIWRIWKRRC